MPPINVSTPEGSFGWRPAAWLRVSGADAATFLQGQFTNDLRALRRGEAAYGLWLSLKGKVEADSFVVRGGGERPSGADTAGEAGAAGAEFFVASYFSAAAAIRERLESFIIADDVVVEDFTSEVRAVSVWPAAWAVPSEVVAAFGGRRGAGPNAEWIFPAGAEAAVRGALAGLREASAEEIERVRIEAGIPAVPRDIGPGDLPNEARLDEVAISYTKGCYLGQEVMARLKSMGQVRRRLLRVAGVAGGASPEPAGLPAPLFLGERQVGELRSSCGDGAGGVIGLAMVSRLHVATGAELALAKNAAPAFRVVDPL